jgi:hypothetical protein
MTQNLLTEGEPYPNAEKKTKHNDSKDFVIQLLDAMNYDLQRASSGNFPHLAANLRGSIIYIKELIQNDWCDHID